MVCLPIVSEPEPDEDPTGDVVLPVAIDLTIDDDGTVAGTVGDAELVDCMLKQNRGEVGPQLNLATEHNIMDGDLADAIVPEDETSEKNITIPFNLVESDLRGSLLWAKVGKYLRPLLPWIDLVKEQ